MWSDSTATRLSIVNHCFILKGVFDFCLVYAHFYSQAPSCFQKYTRQCFVLPSLSLICSLWLFVLLRTKDAFGHCTNLFLIGTFALDFFVRPCIAVSPCHFHTRPPTVFTDQEVAAFYWERKLCDLGGWIVGGNVLMENQLENQENEMSGSEICFL